MTSKLVLTNQKELSHRMGLVKETKLNIYEQLELMNACCHNKGKPEFEHWSFHRETKKYCHVIYENAHSYSSPTTKSMSIL